MDYKKKVIESSDTEPLAAEESAPAYPFSGEISTTDAIWALIANQAREVQQTIKIRLDKLLSASEDLTPYTTEELLDRIEESEKQIEAGDVLPGEQVHQEMRDYVNSFGL